MGAAESTTGENRSFGVVGVAQLVERCVVVADVAGSSPVTHPKNVRAVLLVGTARTHVVR